MSPIRIGTRGSALALAQAGLVGDALRAADGGDEVELVAITTTGDRGAGGDKSRFVKEIDAAVLRGEVDLAVHSAKDVPGELPDGLAILGVPPRADPRDAVCGAGSLDELAEGAAVGTSSLRRRAQLLARRPDLRIEELRGNVDTRLRRLAGGDFDALVLAAAGLDRLGRSSDGRPIGVDTVVPAGGQGALVLQGRSADEETAARCRAVSDDGSFTRLLAERSLVRALDASCRTPLGVHAREDGTALRVDAFAGLPDGSWWIRDTVSGSPDDPEALGRALADRMRAAGAGDLLREAEGGERSGQ
ncbi:MAG: hydroxymethylbilane synthase [Actinobacteria bacterium]|nr:hydroxymethylbilane synthase [Actinomycetota bacterium]